MEDRTAKHSKISSWQLMVYFCSFFYINTGWQYFTKYTLEELNVNKVLVGCKKSGMNIDVVWELW